MNNSFDLGMRPTNVSHSQAARQKWAAPQMISVVNAASAKLSPTGLSLDGYYEGDTPLRNLTS